MDQPSDLLLGRIINGYRLEELLGRGPLTAVYHARAQDLCLITELTVTVIHIPASFSPSIRARFLERFKRIAAQQDKVRHPLLLPIYGYGEYEGYPYLFTPDMRGETLKSYLQQHGRCSPALALELLAPIADAFKHLHSQGITYQFFDPNNVLLDGTNVIQIIGLGLAQILCLRDMEDVTPRAISSIEPERTPSHLLSIDGSFMGSPAYLAPEVLLDRQPDIRSDIYSMGVMLFEMLTGRLPFSGEEYQTIVRNCLLEPIPPPRAFIPGIPHNLDRLVMRAMQRDVDRRFQNVDEFLSVFTSIVREMALSSTAVPISSPRRVAELQDPTIPRSSLERVTQYKAPAPGAPQPLITHITNPKLPAVAASAAQTAPPAQADTPAEEQESTDPRLPVVRASTTPPPDPKPLTPTQPDLPAARPPAPAQPGLPVAGPPTPPQQHMPAANQSALLQQQAAIANVPTSPLPDTPVAGPPAPPQQQHMSSMGPAAPIPGQQAMQAMEEELPTPFDANLADDMPNPFEDEPDSPSGQQQNRSHSLLNEQPQNNIKPSPEEATRRSGLSDTSDPKAATARRNMPPADLYEDPGFDAPTVYNGRPAMSGAPQNSGMPSGSPPVERNSTPPPPFRTGETSSSESTVRPPRTIISGARGGLASDIRQVGPGMYGMPSGEQGTANSGGYPAPSAPQPAQQERTELAQPAPVGMQSTTSGPQTPDGYHQVPSARIPAVREPMELKPLGIPATKPRSARMSVNMRQLVVLAVLVFVAYISGIVIVPAPAIPQPPPTIVPTPTPVDPGGMCTTPPQQIKYLPSKENPAPSNDWTNAGGTKNDFTNAQACAAQFMLTYLTFDINDAKSLEKSVPMLSVGGKKRFYNHDSDLPIDYMDPAWRASAQKQHLSQTATVMKPTEVYVQTQNQKFLAWMHIHCKVTVKIDGQSQSHEADYTVLLVKVPPTQNDNKDNNNDNNNNDQKTNKGIGWQVSKWRSGSSNYPPPDPL